MERSTYWAVLFPTLVFAVMQEDLLGYLLGALEPQEMRRVAQWLRDDPDARRQLREIERLLRPLEQSYVPVEPPSPDLVARTLADLPPLPAESEFVRDGESSSSRVTLAPMQSRVEAPLDSSLTWLDWVGGAVAAAVLLGLLLPSLAEGRFEARKSVCQNHLIQFGTALQRFVQRNQQRRLPEVAETGREAFAGIYAVHLKDVGLLDDPDIRWCPSLDRPSEAEVEIAGLDEIANVESLHSASVDQLRAVQRFAGGHYAYSLGVIDEDRYASPQYESRSSFAVMSDAAMTGMSDSQISRDLIGHNGFGINVLYEDGRVQFLPYSSLRSIPDHPLLNHRGEMEAGVNVDDASLAPSWRPPFVNVRQR